MAYENELSFYRKLMQNLNVQTLRFSTEETPEADLGLRRLLGLPTYRNRDFSMSSHRTIYHGIDSFGCSYNWMLLPDTNEVLLTGPYLLEEYSETDTMALLERYRLPPSLLRTLQLYYKAIVFFGQDNLMAMLLNTLAEAIWGEKDAFAVQQVSLSTFSKEDVPQTDDRHGTESMDIQLLETRYAGEQRLMHAVAHGMTQQALRMISATQEHLLEQRSSDRVRNMKNYGIVLNTLLRKAAESGGVHPLHLDQLSSKCAHELERCLNSTEIYRHFLQMVEEYCSLVRTHSLKDYSPLVRRVILRIESDLTADLGLHAHADALKVNVSYLSSLFHSETGIKLTDFVNQRRIQHAKMLLTTTRMQVQTIAQYCGIPDVNYFARLFRKHTGQTPTAYRSTVQP